MLPTSSSAKEHSVRTDIVPGGTFPDCQLTDHTKIRRRLSELFSQRPSDPAMIIP
jgi:hypothetical protein